MDSRPYTSKRRVAMKITFCIVTSILFSSTFVIETIHNLPFRTVELLFCLIPGCFLYIVVYYFKLSKVVRLNQMNNLPLGPQDASDNPAQRPPSRHLALNKSIFLLIASSIVAYSPTSVTAIIQNISYRLNIQPSKGTMVAIVWGTTFSFSNSVMDPLIYTYRSDAIGRELVRVILHLFTLVFQLLSLYEMQWRRSGLFVGGGGGLFSYMYLYRKLRTWYT